jgi:hypothetical protein
MKQTSPYKYQTQFNYSIVSKSSLTGRQCTSVGNMLACGLVGPHSESWFRWKKKFTLFLLFRDLKLWNGLDHLPLSTNGCLMIYS